ncbi:MAG: DEAD/DEAH box helicase [Chloroflexi bacterium]|nr:DEAD/DEAH box helicase [Chloroflexota bacterium]
MDAVRRGLAMIDAHGGCYVGDVVGLGKTFIGAELLRQLRISYPHDGPPLILCPAGLKPMWEAFNERFALGAEVVSHSMIAAPSDPEYDEETGRYVDSAPLGHGINLVQQFPNRGPVLVDEAHNFRNVNQRSRGLRNYLERGDHKVALLSATPQNLGPMDIYRQLTLFLDDTDHGLNLEPVSLEAYFQAAQRWMEYRVDYENYLADIKPGTAAPMAPRRHCRLPDRASRGRR